MAPVELADEVRGVIGHHPVPVLLPVQLGGEVGMITMGERVEVETSAHLYVRWVDVDERFGVASVTVDDGHPVRAQHCDPGREGTDRGHPLGELAAVEPGVDLVVAVLSDAADRASVKDP
jgi:hypothetical protein